MKIKLRLPVRLHLWLFKHSTRYRDQVIDEDIRRADEFEGLWWRAIREDEYPVPGNHHRKGAA